MENVLCAKMQPNVRKVKKKQGKDEMDRIKQAEKKKRRLEKALATSAAIRLELEKKKQKKKEEQQRLDEEGAAIAEAVALNVLLGEDSEDSCKLMLKKSNCWDFPNNNVGLFAGGRMLNLPHQNVSRCSFVGGVGWPSSNAYGLEYDAGNTTFWSGSCARSIYAPCFGEEDVRSRRTEDATSAAGALAAQALSSLQIGEDQKLDAVILNGMFERLNSSQGF
uniref:Uncharacterized protein n=1 Tax=Kalanchoe fedtschenkoi TaxID=63787 RepID=A0A7N0RB92_KALFE